MHKGIFQLLERFERRSRLIASAFVVLLFLSMFIIGPAIKHFGVAGETKDIVYDYKKWYLQVSQDDVKLTYPYDSESDCKKFADEMVSKRMAAACYRGDEMQMKKYK